MIDVKSSPAQKIISLFKLSRKLRLELNWCVKCFSSKERSHQWAKHAQNGYVSTQMVLGVVACCTSPCIWYRSCLVGELDGSFAWNGHCHVQLLCSQVPVLLKRLRQLPADARPWWPHLLRGTRLHPHPWTLHHPLPWGHAGSQPHSPEDTGHPSGSCDRGQHHR